MISMPSLLGAPSSVALAISLNAARASVAAAATGGGTPTPSPTPTSTTTAFRRSIVTPYGETSGLNEVPSSPAFANIAATGEVITIDGSKTYQKYDGTGAAITDAVVQLSTALGMSDAQRAAWIDQNFGVNGILDPIIRIPMGLSDFSNTNQFYTYYDGTDPSPAAVSAGFSIQKDIDRGIIKVLKEILAKNPRTIVLAVPWSPPVVFKSVSNLVGGNFVSSDTNYKGYARYFREFVQRYAAQGIPVSWTSIQNEGNFAPGYPGCIWTGTQYAEFAPYLALEYSANGITTEIHAGDTSWTPVEDRVSAVRASAAATAAVKAYEYHCYEGRPDRQLTDVPDYLNGPARIGISEMRSKKDQHGLAAGDLNSARALMAADVFINTMRKGSSFVILWNWLLDTAGYPSQNPDSAQNPRSGVQTVTRVTGAVTPTDDFWVLHHFGRYLRRGAVRIDSTSPAVGKKVNGLQTVAFKLTDGTKFAFLYNLTNTTKTVSLFDKDTGLATPSFTMGPEEMRTELYGLQGVASGGAVTPAPTFSAAPTIETDGSPSVGETAIGHDGTVANGGVSARQWLFNEGPISGAIEEMFTFDRAGSYTYRNTASGPGGSGVTSTSAAIVVAAASTGTPTPAPTPAVVTDSTKPVLMGATSFAKYTTNDVGKTVNLTIDTDATLALLAIEYTLTGNSTTTPTSSDDLTNSNVTCGGVAMTRLSNAKVLSGTSGVRNRGLELWYLFNPPKGAQTLSYDMAKAGGGSTTVDQIATAMSVKNAASFGAPVVASSPSTAPVAALSATTNASMNSLILELAAIRSATVSTLDGGETTIVNDVSKSGGNMLGVVAYQAGGTGKVSSASWATADVACAAFVPINNS